MKEENFQIGRLVRSRQGRDAGRYFIITGFPEVFDSELKSAIEALGFNIKQKQE